MTFIVGVPTFINGVPTSIVEVLTFIVGVPSFIVGPLTFNDGGWNSIVEPLTLNDGVPTFNDEGSGFIVQYSTLIVESSEALVECWKLNGEYSRFNRRRDILEWLATLQMRKN